MGSGIERGYGDNLVGASPPEVAADASNSRDFANAEVARGSQYTVRWLARVSQC